MARGGIKKMIFSLSLSRCTSYCFGRYFGIFGLL